MVQNALDYIASSMERIKKQIFHIIICFDPYGYYFSTFNFSVPFLSVMAIVVLVFLTIVLYFVPLRWIVMLWGDLWIV